MSDRQMADHQEAHSAATKRKRGAPSKRERELCEAIRDAADDVTKATDYAEGYMARVALARAMKNLNEWAMAGRPHVRTR